MISLQALQDTLNLNNKAATMYHSKHLPEAAKIYYESLCLVQELLNCSEQEESMNHHPLHTTADAITHLPQHACFHTTTQTSSDVSAQEELFVYQNALLFPESPLSSHAQPVVPAMNLYFAGILFNAAILHHQHSIKTGLSASLNRAEQIYIASLQLVAGLSTSNDTVAVIAIAASNNLAQIEFDKGLTMQANERLQFLLDLLHSLEHTADRIFTVAEFHGMLSNTPLANSIATSPAA